MLGVAALAAGCASSPSRPVYAPHERDFVLPGLSVALAGQSVTQATWRAEHAGIFSFLCTIPAHAPEMYGQLVVLPAEVGAGFADPGTAHRH